MCLERAENDTAALARSQAATQRAATSYQSQRDALAQQLQAAEKEMEAAAAESKKQFEALQAQAAAEIQETKQERIDKLKMETEEKKKQL